MRESDWLNPPFLSGQLEPLDWSQMGPDRLNKLENKPGIIIRWFSDPWMKYEGEEKAAYGKWAKHVLDVCARLFKKGVNIPLIGAAIARREGKMGICTAVKEIEHEGKRGKNLDEMLILPERASEQLDQQLYLLVEDAYEALQHSQPVLWDIKAAQYVYGHPAGENGPDDFWLVDVGPEGIFGKKEKFDIDRMVEFLDRLEGRVIILEQKFNVQLLKTREIIRRVYKELGTDPVSE